MNLGLPISSGHFWEFSQYFKELISSSVRVSFVAHLGYGFDVATNRYNQAHIKFMHPWTFFGSWTLTFVFYKQQTILASLNMHTCHAFQLPFFPLSSSLSVITNKFI